MSSYSIQIYIYILHINVLTHWAQSDYMLDSMLNILDCIYFLLLWNVLKMWEKCCYGTFKKKKTKSLLRHIVPLAS